LTTLTLPGLADLREQVDAVLMDDDRQSRLVDELETLRSSDIGYIGPDPEPVTRRMVQALAGQGITTTFTTAGGPAIVPLQGSNGITWGLTNRSDDPTEKQRIFVSELTSPRGRAIVLAHEAGHALTWDSRLHLRLGPLGDALMEYTVGLSADYIFDEIIAETTAYLVAQATGIDFAPEYHAAYIAGYESKLPPIPEFHSEIWERASLYARQAAEVLLS
jgi:hypothetical protein